jgi:hypothetical protein
MRLMDHLYYLHVLQNFQKLPVADRKELLKAAGLEGQTRLAHKRKSTAKRRK